MVRGARKAVAVGVAVAVACSVQQHLNFVPGPRHAAPVAAAAASMMMAPAAFADEIGDAAKKLGDASYSFAKEVDWNNGIFLQAPGKFQPLKALKAIDKMIEMGAAADPKLLKEAAEAHHKAIGSISGPNGVTSRADWDAVNAALGRVVASVPKAKVMAVYDSVKDITDPKVPAYMKSLVNGPDAEKAYQGFLEFKDVVAKNQVTTASAPAVVPSGDKIGVAAKALSDASYPFIKDIDWLSDIYLKPLPGKTAPETLKAIDKMIVMGAKMDGNLLKAAAEAHHKAIGSIDAKGVTSAADYEAVNAAIGRIVASVPKATVMDVYNSMAGVVDSTVTNNMFSKVNPLDAVAAAKGFYTFKDVVEASQRWRWRPPTWSFDIALICFDSFFNLVSCIARASETNGKKLTFCFVAFCRQCIARCSSHVFQIIRCLSRHKSHSYASIQLEAPKPCTNSQLTDLEPNTSSSWSLSMTRFLHVLAMDWCCSCTKMTSQKHHEMVMKWKWTVTKNHPASDWMWSVIALFCYVLLWYVVHLIAHRNRVSP